MDKQSLRERVWDDLEESGEARFPFPPHDRIPNFAGAKRAAERLAGTDQWRAADRVKANPDAPQLPVRRAALREGKTLYVAVPRLREAECFETASHDVPLDLVVTPERVVETGASRKPTGIEWDLLSGERVAEIPVLERFRS